jgi:hypothetical protein
MNAAHARSVDKPQEHRANRFDHLVLQMPRPAHHANLPIGESKPPRLLTCAPVISLISGDSGPPTAPTVTTSPSDNNADRAIILW